MGAGPLKWHLARRPTSRYALSYRDVEELLACTQRKWSAQDTPSSRMSVAHHELGVDVDPRHRLPAVFTELVLAI